jgi:hypothetical protein
VTISNRRKKTKNKDPTKGNNKPFYTLEHLVEGRLQDDF